MTLHEITPPGQETTASGSRWGRRWGIGRFLRDAHGGATTIMAGMVVAVIAGAAALVVDHVWLVDQRDVLKMASDAAAVATTIELERHGGTLTDAELQESIQEIAKTYVELNMEYLGEDKRRRAKESLAIVTSSDLEHSTVDVRVDADLGGTLVARHLAVARHYKGPESTQTGAQVEVILTPIEVVLAIDVSTSMAGTIDGRYIDAGDESRMNIVKEAAKQLVDIVPPSAEQKIAIGVVPWASYVRLDTDTRTQWVDSGWAAYPRSRHYAEPYGCEPLETCIAPSTDEMLPPSPGQEWLGCLDEHRVTGADHAAHSGQSDWFDAPSEDAFAQAIYPALDYHSYNCPSPPLLPSGFYLQYCYGLVDKSAFRNRNRVLYNLVTGTAPQTRCTADTPTISPLSTDRTVVNAAIDTLLPVGTHTYSSLGVLWGQRLLTPEWKSIWGGAVHPVNAAALSGRGTRKVIVLLTDGEDNQCGRTDPLCETTDVGIGRTDACTAAKAAGTKIYVVAVMHARSVSSATEEALRACSSESDDPQNNYVFVNNTDGDSIKAAFVEIANQLQSIRRVH